MGRLLLLMAGETDNKPLDSSVREGIIIMVYHSGKNFLEEIS